MSTRIENVSLKELVRGFFVREKLDVERVEMFRKAYESRKKVPELLAGRIKDDETGTMYLVDGRHRDAALTLLERDKTDCEVKVYSSVPEMIAEALEKNWGGSLPPTEADTLHTVRLLVENNTSLTQATRMLAFLGGKQVRELYVKAENLIKDAQMKKARRAIVNGMALDDAVTEYGVDKAKLRRVLAGESKQPERSAAGQIQLRISNRYKAVAPSITKIMADVNRMFQSSELTEKEVRNIFTHIRRLNDNLVRSVDEGERRFNALPGVKQIVPSS